MKQRSRRIDECMQYIGRLAQLQSTNTYLVSTLSRNFFAMKLSDGLELYRIIVLDMNVWMSTTLYRNFHRFINVIIILPYPTCSNIKTSGRMQKCKSSTGTCEFPSWLSDQPASLTSRTQHKTHRRLVEILPDPLHGSSNQHEPIVWYNMSIIAVVFWPCPVLSASVVCHLEIVRWANLDSGPGFQYRSCSHEVLLSVVPDYMQLQTKL